MQTRKLIDRITALARVNLDDLLMDAADPQEAMAHWRAEADSGLAQAKDALAAALVQERQLEQQWQATQASIAEWDARVDDALRAGDDEAARVALRRQASYHQAAQELQMALDRQRQVVSKIKASVNALQARLQDLPGFKKPGRSTGENL